MSEASPPDPDLAAMRDAFDRGDYAAVRKDAKKIEASDKSDRVKKDARAILVRTTAHPIAKYMFLLALALLTLLSFYWVSESKKDHSVPTQVPLSAPPPVSAHSSSGAPHAK